MKLVMTLFVRNEEDILEANLDYHLEQGVDFIIATENRSEDGTRSILERYAREGHLRLLAEESDTYSQPEGMTRMARLAAEDHGADWVINHDADAFWWPREGTLKDIFAAIPGDYGALAASRVYFVARPREDGFFAQRLTFAGVREVSATADPPALKYPFDRYAHYIMPKVAHRTREDLEVVNGSHAVLGDGLATVPGWHPVDILHFPLRSYPRFERKVRNGGRGLERHPDPLCRELFALYEEGRLPEYWADTSSDDEAVAAGIASGRLMVDRRLQQWFARREDALRATSSISSDRWLEPPELEADMLRSITVGEWYASRTAGLERRLVTRGEQVRRLKGRLEKAEAARQALLKPRAARNGFRWRRLSSVVDRVPRLAHHTPSPTTDRSPR